MTAVPTGPNRPFGRPVGCRTFAEPRWSRLPSPALPLCTSVHTFTVDYEWDPAKAEANLAKHGVRFADAVLVFSDAGALTIDHPHPDEERFVTVGMDALARVLVVVWTWRGETTIRLISARHPTRREREQYVRGES